MELHTILQLKTYMLQVNTGRRCMRLGLLHRGLFKHTKFKIFWVPCGVSLFDDERLWREIGWVSTVTELIVKHGAPRSYLCETLCFTASSVAVLTPQPSISSNSFPMPEESYLETTYITELHFLASLNALKLDRNPFQNEGSKCGLPNLYLLLSSEI